MSLLDTDFLSRMIKHRRGNKTLRELADEIDGISFPTLSRIEAGRLPDVENFIRICKWLDMPMDVFIKQKNQTD